MSSHDLIDDYLSELMDDPGKGDPRAAQHKPSGKQPAPSSDSQPDPEPAADGSDSPAAEQVEAPAGDPLAAFREGSPNISDDEFEAMLDALEGKPQADDEPSMTTTADADSDPEAAADARGDADPLAAFRQGSDEIGEDEFEAMLDAMQGKPSPGPAGAEGEAAGGDPLAAFRSGGDEIGEDEFEAMLDALEGKPVAAPQAPAEPAGQGDGDPLAAFRQGGDEISEDEFEAMLDALQGSGDAPATPAPAAAPAPARTRSPLPTPTGAASRAIEALLPPSEPAPAHGEPSAPSERRRRAEDKVAAWLRFNLARQSFAVEVLKVQEVLRVPLILPVRGTDEATLGVMNLRGQIVPVMDLAVRLGFPPTEPNEASRVIVLEEKGETLGLLVASVADVVNLSEGRMERISGTPSLLAAEVVRGVSRREGLIIIMLDASRLLA
ncbi:chemotaxis protein CheW [Pseudomarimonas salicorniae]|uniref:Chemotaxis protein CheW n=1 Tax=Pseudomarimonas salicorniae TaxID=2933270 RepID=A0ABT0GL53_9GAMM|nr:chemotaxis protein CheW [Lysobacter sp. CAU 1642]MCK7595127.1 chemotaxis protein CheW [Lysobacter sp. CAU 1642]